MTSFAGFNYLERAFKGTKTQIETSSGIRVGKLIQFNADIIEMEIHGQRIFILPDKIISICSAESEAV